MNWDCPSACDFETSPASTFSADLVDGWKCSPTILSSNAPTTFPVPNADEVDRSRNFPISRYFPVRPPVERKARMRSKKHRSYRLDQSSDENTRSIGHSLRVFRLLTQSFVTRHRLFDNQHDFCPLPKPLFLSFVDHGVRVTHHYIDQKECDCLPKSDERTGDQHVH